LLEKYRKFYGKIVPPHITTVTSHQIAQQSSRHSMRVRPSGRFLSNLGRPCGYLMNEKSTFDKTNHIKLFIKWWRRKRRGFRLQNRPNAWNLRVSTEAQPMQWSGWQLLLLLLLLLLWISVQYVIIRSLTQIFLETTIDETVVLQSYDFTPRWSNSFLHYITLQLKYKYDDPESM